MNELYHHGVKGMKWGVRKDRQTGTSNSKKTSRPELTPKQKRIARNVAIGAAVAAAAVGGVVLYSTIKDKDVQKRYTETGRKAVEKAINDRINVEINSDINMWASIDPERAESIRANRDELLKERRNSINKKVYDTEVKQLGKSAYEAAKKNRAIINKNRKIRKGRGDILDSPIPAHMMWKDPRKHYNAPYDILLKHIDDDENYLAHHGVKGMKWGVRKERELVGRKRRSSTKSTRKRNATTREGAGLLKKKQSKKEVFPPYVNEQVVRQMNPTNNQMNCAFTSTGYVVNKITSKNVTANAFEPGMLGDLTANTGTSPDFFEKALSNTTRSKFSDAKYFRDLPTMTEATKNIKDNSYGIIFVQHPLGCGHYVNYEKRNGVTTIIDCQGTAFTGKQVNSPDAWSKKGVRAIEYWDCTNASISPEGQSKYLNKILRES